MNNEKYKYLSNAYFRGQLSKKAQNQLMEWLRADDAHEQLFRTWEKEWAASEACRQLTDSAWERFKSLRDNQPSAASSKPKAAPITQPLHPSRKKYAFAAAAAAAAAALIMLLLAIPFVRYILPDGQGEQPLLAQAETVNSSDSIVDFTLSDQSRVVLSPHAKLTYDADFGKERRAVRLQGSARFEVQKNKDCPFTVTAENVVVEVTGTTFTVSADSLDDMVRVQLFEGGVSVHVDDTTYLLLPNEELTYSKQQHTVSYCSQSLAGVLQRLAKKTNTTIVIKDSPVMRQLVRIHTSEQQTAEEIFDALAEIYELNMVYQNDSLLINEMYETD